MRRSDFLALTSITPNYLRHLARNDLVPGKPRRENDEGWGEYEPDLVYLMNVTLALGRAGPTLPKAKRFVDNHRDALLALAKRALEEPSVELWFGCLRTGASGLDEGKLNSATSDEFVGGDILSVAVSIKTMSQAAAIKGKNPDGLIGSVFDCVLINASAEIAQLLLIANDRRLRDEVETGLRSYRVRSGGDDGSS